MEAVWAGTGCSGEDEAGVGGRQCERVTREGGHEENSVPEHSFLQAKALYTDLGGKIKASQVESSPV